MGMARRFDPSLGAVRPRSTQASPSSAPARRRFAPARRRFAPARPGIRRNGSLSTAPAGTRTRTAPVRARTRTRTAPVRARTR
jgi:hypothetical protein